MQGSHHALLNFCAVDKTKELRICWEKDDDDNHELKITIHGADVKLNWVVRKDKVRNEWNKYCFVVRSRSGGDIKVECQIFGCSG